MKPERMVRLFKKLRLPISGAIVGAVAGWLYWKFVGCPSGNCAITSNPLNSAAYGAVMGALLFSIFERRENKTRDNKHQ